MNKLNYYRKKIDLIDKKIVELLLLRFKLIKHLSNYKQKNKFKIVDKKREIQVINNIKKISKHHKKIAADIFKKIISYSRKIQK